MIKLATIGTSWITEQFISACLDNGNYELSKVYSRDIYKAQAFVDKFDAGQAVDVRKHLYTEDVDVIYIASPNSLHFEHAMEAMNAGKHVIIEKPQFSSVFEWEQAHQLAKHKQVFIFEAVRHIHTDAYHYLKKLMEYRVHTLNYPFLGANFSIGQYSSKYDLYLDSLKDHIEVPNIFNPDFSGGSLMDLGIYPLYVAVALFGKPENVKYECVEGNNGVDLLGTIILHYHTYMVTIFVSKAVVSRQVNEVYVGDETIEISHISDLTFISLINRQGDCLDEFQYLPDNPLSDEVAFFADVMNGKARQSTYMELESLSYDVMSVIEALNQYRDD